MRKSYRYMCADLDRATLNRKIVKERLYVEAYPTDAQLKAKGVPISRAWVVRNLGT